MDTSLTLNVPAADASVDHCLGSPTARHTLIEYGSYACSYCRDAQGVIDRVKSRLGDDLVYVFRHKPLDSDPFAVPAAILAEGLAQEGRFFEAHTTLMQHAIRSREDLERVAARLDVDTVTLDAYLNDDRLKSRLREAQAEAKAAGVVSTPTFLLDGRHYTDAWDEMTLLEAIDPPVANRVDRVMRTFAGWAPATGLLLAACALVALLLANSPWAGVFNSFWDTSLGLSAGDFAFEMTARHWVNDGLMALFFLVVGLEIKRELTIGTLSQHSDAILPAGAAVGGMLVPAALFLTIASGTEFVGGWGIPMATDIAFALGLLALLGRRVPLQLKVFLTALAIVDDLGAIVVIAVFYGHGFEPMFGLVALGCVVALAVINIAGVYAALPYVVLGVCLWLAVYASGVHATLAGILLAIAVPTRPPPNLQGLMAQAQAIIDPELERLRSSEGGYPTRSVIRQLDAVHDRIESPAHRIERSLEPWSSFAILPIFALANAGVVLGGELLDGRLILAIGLGLIVGKPLGIFAAVWLLSRTPFANWPAMIPPSALVGVGALAGVGFTMSLFIANEAFTASSLTASAKLGVLGASVMAAIVGLFILNRYLPAIAGGTLHSSNREATS